MTISRSSGNQSYLAQRVTQPSGVKGFTLIELLVVLGVVAVLLSLVVPYLGRSRGEARVAGSLASIRAIGIALQSYADENNDLPPVFFRPIAGHYPETPQQQVEVLGRSVQGYWFDQAFDYHMAFGPPLPLKTLQSPGRPAEWIDTGGGVPTTSLTDYNLTETLYAEPAYWDRWTQAGISQWKVQRLSSIRFPTSKGLLYQVFVYHMPGRSLRQQVPMFDGVAGAVAWADLSAQNIVQSSLLPGEPNFHAHWPAHRPTFLDNGWAIRATRDGVFGRDRP